MSFSITTYEEGDRGRLVLATVSAGATYTVDYEPVGKVNTIGFKLKYTKDTATLTLSVSGCGYDWRRPDYFFRTKIDSSNVLIVETVTVNESGNKVYIVNPFTTEKKIRLNIAISADSGSLEVSVMENNVF